MSNFNIASMLRQAGGPVTITSVLINANMLKPETVDAIRNASIVAAVNKASELWGPAQPLTVRDLNGTDMGYTNNVMTVTSSTVNTWNALAAGSGTFTVRTATVLAIYGVAVSWIFDATMDEMPVTGIRIDVGGSRQAQWHLQCLDQVCSAASTSPQVPLVGVTRSPVVVAEDITVTIYEYSRRATQAYNPCWLGVAVEKEGVTLKP